MLIDSSFISTAVVKFSMTILLTFIMGIERECHDHPGGVITHILVGLGSCLYSLVSLHVGGPNVDPSRIAAQIVSGIGFLGSATVFKAERFVKGINTAANLWISAAVGMAVGFDLWEFAAILSLFVCIILIISNFYKKKMYKWKRERKQKERNKMTKSTLNLMPPLEDYDSDKDIVIDEDDEEL